MARKNSAHLFISLVTIFAVRGAMAANNNSTTKPSIADYTRPLSFEPNRGQTNKQVDFLAHGAGYSLFLSHAQAVMVLRRGDPPRPGSNSRPTPISSVTVRMRPFGGNASALVDALGELPGKSNYFVGSGPERWHAGIPNYAKVRYGNVYPGVDMIYYGNQKELEYDFVVRPGADPGSISLEFQGASKAELDREGGLVMHTAAGDLRWHKPVAYQEVNGTRKLVACAYAPRDGQRLGFALGAYDSTQLLIIDPELEYSSVLGGIILDQGKAIAVDGHGNAYVTGTVRSNDFPTTDFPTTKDAFQTSLRSYRNAFVTKFNPKGEVIYSTFLGGSGFGFSFDNGDNGNGIAIDRYGNAYVTGDTASPDFPVKNPFQPTLKSSNGLSNAFVTKLDRDGRALIYSTFLGGSFANTGFSVGDAGYGIAVDTECSAYVTGLARSGDFPTKNPLPDEHKDTEANVFVTKLCPAGNSLVYSTYLGGGEGLGIAVDRHRYAYVTGVTGDSDFPTKNAFQQQRKSEFAGSAFVTKFDTAGDSLIYSTYLGGSGDLYGFGDIGFGIAVDVHGNAYITGSTASSDFPTKNPFQPSLQVTGDLSPTAAFVTKLDSSGSTLVYSTYLSGSGDPPFAPGDAGFGIAVDTRGSAYVTGVATSPDFPTKNAFQSTAGGMNAFVTKFDPDGTTLVYSSFLGGSIGLGDRANGIGVDTQGNAYLTGMVGTGNFPTKNSVQNPPGGVFVTKISAR